jgi:hypothetical protein
MAVSNFIPTIWAGTLLRNLNKTAVFADLCNRDYEGDIRDFGDSVKINSIGPVTVSAYTRNTDLSAAETIASAQEFMLIDQGWSFNFQVDDVDAAQVNPKIMEGAMTEASYGLTNKQDTLLAALYTSTSSSNAIGSAGSPRVVGTDTAGGNTLAYTILVQAGVLLDNANVPVEGRWIVVPPWFLGLLLLDERFVSFGTDPNRDVLQNGRVGRAAGFDIRVSNNVSNDATTWRPMFGHSMGITLAEQIVKVEAYRPQARFADAVKGLHVYGYKVVRPAAMGVGYCNKGVGAI